MRKGTNGRSVGDLNAAKLEAWLETVKELPMHGGRPNKTEIARLAKLKDRQPLENNTRCRELLAEAVKTKGLTTVSKSDEEKLRLERRLRALEIRADKEMAENFELKRQLRKLRHIEKIIEAGGRFIP